MEEIRISCLYPFCQTLHFSPSKSRYLHHICSLQQFSCFTKSHSLIASLPVLLSIFSYRFSQISASSPTVSDVQDPVRLSLAAVYREHEASKPFRDDFFKSGILGNPANIHAEALEQQSLFKPPFHTSQTAFLLSSCCIRVQPPQPLLVVIIIIELDFSAVPRDDESLIYHGETSIIGTCITARGRFLLTSPVCLRSPAFPSSGVSLRDVGPFS